MPIGPIVPYGGRPLKEPEPQGLLGVSPFGKPLVETRSSLLTSNTNATPAYQEPSLIRRSLASTPNATSAYQEPFNAQSLVTMAENQAGTSDLSSKPLSLMKQPQPEQRELSPEHTERFTVSQNPATLLNAEAYEYALRLFPTLTPTQSKYAIDVMRAGGTLAELRASGIFPLNTASYEELFRASTSVKDAVIYGNYSFALMQARKLFGRLGFLGIPLEDFYGEAVGIGLTKAVEKFESYGVPFGAYVSFCTRNAIIDMVREQIQAYPHTKQDAKGNYNQLPIERIDELIKTEERNINAGGMEIERTYADPKTSGFEEKVGSNLTRSRLLEKFSLSELEQEAFIALSEGLKPRDLAAAWGKNSKWVNQFIHRARRRIYHNFSREDAHRMLDGEL